jgi:hypothetical protein
MMARQKAYQNSPTLKSLLEEAVANPPQGGSANGAANGGFAGSPLIVGAAVNQGEKSIGVMPGEVYPEVYGASRATQVKTQPGIRKTRGQSGSGVVGSTSATGSSIPSN